MVVTKAPPLPPKGLTTGAKASARSSWDEVLRRCNLPTTVIVLDFETFFSKDFNMRSGAGLSTLEFVKDSRFEVLSLAITTMSPAHLPARYAEQTDFVCGEDKVAGALAYLETLYGRHLQEVTVVAQNAQFELSVLAHRYNIYPKHVIDLLGLARAWNSRDRNDLGTLAKRWKLPAKGETMEFQGCTFRQRFMKGKGRKKGPKLPVQMPTMTADQVEALRVYNTGDNLREWELFTILLPLLSNPEVELPIMQHTLELYTKPVLRLNPATGLELVGLYENQIDAALPPGLTRTDISKNTSFEGRLCEAIKFAGENPMDYHKVCKKGWMMALAKADPERVKLLNHPDPRVRALMEARVALKSWPLHIARVKRMMRMAEACDGFLPIPLKYHGAHTGRWAGGEKVNVQNLGKRGDPLITRIREMIEAPDGQTLAVVDLSAIEARGLAWIAGQDDLTEKFKNGEEIYCGFASKVLGYPVRRARKSGGIEAIEHRMRWARDAIGKVGILGCGYGMGGDKAQAFARGALTLEQAHKLVKTYRAEHPKITGFWRDVEKAFTYTARYRQPCALPRGLRFHAHNDCAVILTLPNGRELHYHQVKFEADGYGRDRAYVYNALEHSWEGTWGGTITENIVQALSRDIIAEAILRLEARGIHVAHHCHDEVVVSCPIDQGESTLPLVIEELTRTPAWAADLPLGAEGKISKGYGG